MYISKLKPPIIFTIGTFFTLGKLNIKKKNAKLNVIGSNVTLFVAKYKKIKLIPIDVFILSFSIILLWKYPINKPTQNAGVLRYLQYDTPKYLAIK